MSLERFYVAQEDSYGQALKEIKTGRKRSHWMWYIFPQIAGLGMSSMAQYYAIAGLEEAKEYMADQVLGGRLLEISGALLDLETDDAHEVFGYPDDMKLRSSMTLFEAAAPEQEVFRKVLDKYFGGKRDERTLQLLRKI